MSSGHCLCGSISYRFDVRPETVVLCHCEECQRHTGSAFSVNVLVARDAVEIKGKPRSHQTVGSENSNLRDRLFCGDCGTPIFTVMHEHPGIIIVKAGTLDDRAGLAPSAEVWWRRAQDWIEPSPARPRFEGDLKHWHVGTSKRCVLSRGATGMWFGVHLNPCVRKETRPPGPFPSWRPARRRGVSFEDPCPRNLAVAGA